MMHLQLRLFLGFLVPLLGHESLHAQEPATKTQSVESQKAQTTPLPATDPKSVDQRSTATPAKSDPTPPAAKASEAAPTTATKVEPEPKKTEAKKAEPLKVRVEQEGFDIIAGPWLDEHSTSTDQAAVTLRNVKLHLKFGVVEFGNVNEFVIARKLLGGITKERRREQGPDLATSPPWIEFARQEADRLEQSARATLFGGYPLIRGFQLPFAENEEDYRVNTYARYRDAKRNAVRSALERLAKLAPLDPLHVLVLIPGRQSHRQDHDELARLANTESQTAFAKFPNLKVYAGRFREEFDAMPAWEGPDIAFDPICRKFLKQIRPSTEPRSLMIVLLRDFEDQNLHWVQAQYRVFSYTALDKASDDATKLESDRTRIAEALTRDVSSYNAAIWTLIGVLYVLSLVLHERLNSSRCRELGDRPARFVGLPSLGFVLGMVLTRLAMLALADWLPNPRVSAWSGIWWPSIAGSISLILPIGVFRLTAGTVDRYWPTLSYHGRWGIAFLPVALGIAAAWVHPAFSTNGWGALKFIPAFAVAASTLAYCFGRAIDRADKFPVSMAPITMLLTILFGACAFLGSVPALWSIAFLAFVTLALHGGFGRLGKSVLAASDQAAMSASSLNAEPPTTVEQLRKALVSPIYRGPKRVEKLYRDLMLHDFTHVKWIALTGQKAAGKTAAIHYLQEELQAAPAGFQFLMGSCTHRGQSNSAYQPFRDAFAVLGLPTGLVEAHTCSDSVNSIFDNLAYELIPFWTFFSFDSDSGGENSTQTDLIIAVTNALRTLSQTHPVIFMIDDIQWIDEDSAALLKHLWSTFPPGGEGRISFLLAGRDLAPLGNVSALIETVALPLSSEADQVLILIHSLNIEQASAKHIIKALGIMGQEPGGMYWILRSVRELVDDNLLTPTPRGFVLSPKVLQSGLLPVPHKMRDRLITSLRASGDSLRILECAALLGSRFRVSDVAECLKIDRLELLETLRRLERESQLVLDVPLDQDCYEFSSSFLHEVLREELGVAQNSLRKQNGPSKIARELHARIAEMLLERPHQTKQTIYAIAEHFYEAGESHVAQCAEACQVAIQVARKAGDEATAQRFVALAEQLRLHSRAEERSGESLNQKSKAKNLASTQHLTD